MWGGRFGIWASITLLALLASAASISKAEGETPPVIINEMAWAGSSASSQDEWVELRNNTDEDIDLTGWQLTKDTSGDGSGEALIVEITENTLDPLANAIPGGGYFLIANNGPEHDFGDGKLSVLNIQPNYVDSGMTLSNSNLLIKLYSGEWNSEAELVDTAGDGGTPLSGSNSAKTSMERNAEYGLGNLPENWHEATIATNLDDGVFDQATPGALNSSPSLPAPVVQTVSPNAAETGTTLEIEEITGNNFATEGVTTVQLQRGTHTLTANNVHVASSTVIDTASISLIGAEVGRWDLTVINPDGQAGLLTNAIEITAAEEPEEDVTYSDKIAISEVYPRPDTSSNDEFIELHNTGTASINLKGWRLDDQHPGGSAEYTIGQDLIIEAGRYLSLNKPETHISLNDSGDYVRLIQPDGNVLRETPNYGSAIKGRSYAFIGNQWQRTARVTRNQANILELPDDEAAEDTEEAEDIKLSLDFDDLTSTSVILTWGVKPTVALTNIRVYRSDQEEEIGEIMTTITVGDWEYLVTGLIPDTDYFFTVSASYHGQTVKSNQIEVTTASEAVTNPGEAGQIRITEMLPNPSAGDEEFIELYNATGATINIAGWRLADASGKSYTINALDLPPISITAQEVGTVLIPAGQYVLLEQGITGIHLNNSGGEELYLFDTEDNLIDAISYDSSAKKGFAYVLAPNDKWFWSEESTPGEANDVSFAGVLDDAGEYLTSSGPANKWGWASLISWFFAGIMFTLMKRHENLHY
ncbi:hypothetical protein A2V68_00235 [candidate division Kazan bacterium RBG_13_50_9]|uniref:LTD domain-containing protein n=1 Tax=candidate division Kazan bacterium RBG_13_50_9 TaxID=1798535 RepID=A0A1F4NS50_UNCK3|nr:MAG: hypothetical protein A2V68_00235 [candidate division Kazan bacterium RBG_13_50_9]